MPQASRHDGLLRQLSYSDSLTASSLLRRWTQVRVGLSRAPEMTGREALWRVVRETTEDRPRRPQVNPTPSVLRRILLEVWDSRAEAANCGLSPPFWSELGRVAERLKGHDWKSCGLIPAWVRIPPRPLKEVGSSIPPRPLELRSFLHDLVPRVPAGTFFWAVMCEIRGVAQSGRALRSGRRGPRFKSGRQNRRFSRGGRM